MSSSLFTAIIVSTTILIGSGCVEQPSVSTAPVPPSSPTVVAESNNIRVFEPAPGVRLTSANIRIRGEARVFENVMQWRLRDMVEGVKAEGFVVVDAKDVGQFGSFDFIERSPAFNGPGPVRLELFQFSAKDGSEIDKVIIDFTASSGFAGS